MSSSSSGPSSSSSPPRIIRFNIQSSDVLEDSRIDVLDEETNSVIWFKERYLADNEIVEHVMHNPTSTICWTIHRPLKGWYIRIRSPVFPPGVFIPLTPVLRSSPHYAEASMSFRSRTSLPTDEISSPEASAMSGQHSYPPTPPAVPSLVLQPPSPPSTSKDIEEKPSQPTSKPKEPIRKSLKPPGSVTDFVIAPYLPSASAPSIFSRILSAIRDTDTLGSNSFTISRIAYQSSPPPTTLAVTNDAAYRTSIKCLPLLTFRDRTSLLSSRSTTGLLEIDQLEERLLGVETSFWIAVALTYIDFLGDRGSYLAALSD